MSIGFQTTRRVEFSDTDMAGLSHFSTFVRMMESVEHELLRSLGTSVVVHQDDGATVSWPRVSVQCDFLAPAYFEDVLDVAVSVEKLGRSSLVLRYAFSRDGAAIAKGRMATVCCSISPAEGFESTEIPTALREQLLRLMDKE